MMPYLFDTDDLSDLTDAQIEAVLELTGHANSTAHDVRVCRLEWIAQIALARLMRDHPELFEKPVDPLLEEARKVFVRHHKSGLLSLWLGHTLYKNGALEQQIMSGYFDQHETMLMLRDAIKRGMELAKGGES